MSYSFISLLALILNLIINRETLKNIRVRSSEPKTQQQSIIRYRHFLNVANCYFIADIGWGILYEFHDIEALFPALYIDCLLYFLLMFMTMLTWMRYIVAYLDKKGPRTKFLLGVVWTMFTLGLIYLMINRFHPFIFSFNAEHEYVTEPGRHIAFILQIALYMVTTGYMFYLARKSSGTAKVRYRAVGFTCFVMDLFLILQILNPKYPSYAMGLIIGICVIHAFVEAREMKEKVIYNHIASSLAEDYEAMYYINIETGEFMEFSTSQKYDSMNVPVAGRNFYDETRMNIDRYVHPDDREFAKDLNRKETMLKNLEGKKSYSYKYRLMIDDQPRHFQFTVMRANDDKHFVLYEKDIEDEITAENMRLENQKKHVTFTQIAEILAVNYDVIYYVDAKDSSYISYECRNIYGELDVQKSGDDFFAESRTDISNIVHKGDRDLVLGFVNKDHIISTLMDQKSCSIDYRIVAFKKTHYVRMTVRKTTNDTHYIIGIENIDDEVKKEKQHLKALNTEKELARRDDLTGVKNKTAYNELEKTIQTNLESGMDYLPFALVVCDTNNLKKINDTKGHVAGDEYIKSSASLLCNTFIHSPVFRVGGDEFVVFLGGDDFANREDLIKKLRAQVRENLQSKSGPILASGMAEYAPETDALVSEIFNRADKEMYKNKRELKKEESQLA
ncbi:MAG: GGDEF domain-containing protein [Spirochaetaceae bacterium]|nr:GGDEF domain-containing protein [Spirochaetaceae bacterium]